MIELAKASIRGHEGLRLKPYKCTSGKTTIGYGRNLEDRGISTQEAEALLDRDVAECIQDLATMPYWYELTDARQAALVDMRFCLGAAGFRQFRNMDAALQAGDYQEAARQILKSRFADQTGRRAKNLAEMMERG